MTRRYLIAALFVLLFAGPLGAAGSDFTFEAVNAEVPMGNGVPVAVRLVDKTGNPVAGAVIVRTRLDMAPDGMEGMASEIAPAPSEQPGVYAFKANFTMAGRWQVKLAAMVQGEPQAVLGTVVFKVNQPDERHDHSMHHH